MAAGLEEKRRFPRVLLNVPTTYRIRGRPQYNNTVCKNISYRGLGVINNNFIAPNTILHLELNLLQRFLSVIGKVTWAQPLPHSDNYQIGIEFLELNPIDQNYLGDYIDMQLDKI